jgi:adenylosuccinate synthase
VTAIIGNGVVIDPTVLRQELDDLEARGVSTANLKVSPGAHLIMPYHIMLDHVQETRLGKGKIGTTGRASVPVTPTRLLVWVCACSTWWTRRISASGWRRPCRPKRR